MEFLLEVGCTHSRSKLDIETSQTIYQDYMDSVLHNLHCYLHCLVDLVPN